MNHVCNDRNQWVPAVGAPGSLERTKCERPALIEKMARFVSESRSYWAIRSSLGKARPVLCAAEKIHVLTAAGCTEAQAKSIIGGWAS